MLASFTETDFKPRVSDQKVVMFFDTAHSTVACLL